MLKKMQIYVLVFVVGILTASASAKPGGWGVGLAGFDGDFGIQGRKDLMLGESGKPIICFQGSIFMHNKTTLKLDADYHHVFKPEKPLRLYPLGGLQFAANDRSNRFGLNIGGGLDYSFSKTVEGFLELKYTFGDWDGFGLVGGIRF